MSNYDRVIVWRITQMCNMNCLFCSYSNEVTRQRSIANVCDVNRLIDVLGEYKRIENKKVLVSWIGGEPFLYKEIINLSKRLHELGIDISTTTNGLLLKNEQLCLDVLNYFSEIVFSLDGFEACNDRIRNKNGHYKEVTNIIAKLSNKKKEIASKTVIKVNTILLRENIDQFEDFCMTLVNMGVNELTFNQLGGYDRPEFYQNNRLLQEQIEIFHKRFLSTKDKLANLGLIIHGGEQYMDRIFKSTKDECISIDECNPGRWFWFINENGYISPCSYTSYEYKLSIDSIKTIYDIDMSENIFKEFRKKCRSKWCDNCHCTQLYDKFK